MAGLRAGAAAGVVMIEEGNPIAAFPAFFTDHLVSSLQSSWHVSVLIFTLLLGGFVALIEYGGGMRALLECFLGHVRTQMPYALLAAGISLLAGYVPIGLVVPVRMTLPGAVLVVLFLPVHLRGSFRRIPSGRRAGGLRARVRSGP